MFNFFKKKTPIKVTARFAAGLIFTTEVNNMKELLQVFYRKPEKRFEYWLEDDLDDVPLDGYEITGLVLKDGKVTEVEFTEQFLNGFGNDK